MMPQLERFLVAIFPILFVVTALWLVGSIGYRLWRRRLRGPHFPARKAVELLFEERWTSGRSLDTWWARLGGAKNCLHVGVTADDVWVTCHFPFTFLSADFDLDQRIPRNAITRIEQARKTIRILYATEEDGERGFELHLRNPDRFRQALE